METYNGHVRTPADAILLFEACRIGLLPRVQRRLSEKERQQIKSGSVFVWDEREAGMRRWTDGKSWSASRVSGSFLTYREMEGKRGGNGFAPPPQKRNNSKGSDGSNNGASDDDGPDGYRYKPDGLMKQSFSITTSNGQHLHLISYYSRSHPAASTLMQPTNDPSLRHIRPPKNMYPESTVNEASNVPAVTRGPMPGSPYAQAPHPMGLGSPYARPGATHPQQYLPPNASWPPTPVGTPPYAYAYYPPPGPPPPGQSPLQYAHPAYPPPIYAHPHPGHPTYLDRPPPPISHPGLPPPPAQQPNGYQHSLHTQYPQYPPPGPPPVPQIHPSPRAAQVSQLAQAPPPNGHVYDPRMAPNSQALPASSEQSQGPQLPALTGTVGPATNGEKPPSPKPSEGPSQTNANNLPAPETNGTAANNGSTPGRTIPSLGSLLNNNPTDSVADARSDHSASRAGSKSPNSNAQMNARDIPKEKLSSGGADQMALRRLDKAFAT